MSFSENAMDVTRARSWLFTPASNPSRFANATKSGSDVLILDIEDAVVAEQKGVARDNVRCVLDATNSLSLPPIAVRINSASTLFGLEDLLMLIGALRLPAYIIIPKVEAANDVLHIAALLKNSGRSTALVPMIESAMGLRVVESIAGAGPMVRGLMFGAGDFASDVKASPEALALQIARVRIAAACAQTQILAIGAPCFALHNTERLEADLAFASANGMEAKAAIHPSQIQAINATFTPSSERIAWAKRVITACDSGVGIVDGRMVDEAIAREARRVIAMA